MYLFALMLHYLAFSSLYVDLRCFLHHFFFTQLHMFTVNLAAITSYELYLSPPLRSTQYGYVFRYVYACTCIRYIAVFGRYASNWFFGLGKGEGQNFYWYEFTTHNQSEILKKYAMKIFTTTTGLMLIILSFFLSFFLRSTFSSDRLLSSCSFTHFINMHMLDTHVNGIFGSLLHNNFEQTHTHESWCIAEISVVADE